MKRILDADFRYTPSFGTDIRRTFERIRRERSAPNGSHNNGGKALRVGGEQDFEARGRQVAVLAFRKSR